MASGSTEVLQEYLVKLGYQVDAISSRKFEDSLGKTGKAVFKTGAAIVATVTAVEAATAKFAYSMRQIYFQSELANTSAKNYKALGYAGKQVGADLQAAAHGMAQAMRLNPGLQGLVESLGVKVTGRDTSDVLIDLVDALKQMPEFQATQYAQMFGIDPDTYHQMITHMEELKNKKQEMLNLYKTAGVDPDEAKKTLLEYTSALDQLEARLSILGQAVLIRLAPTFKDITSFLNEKIQQWTDMATGKKVVIFDKYTKQAAKDMYNEGMAPVEKFIKENYSKAQSWANKHLPRGMRNNNPGNLNYVGQAGASKESGNNGRFAVFKTMEEGSAALADQLYRYTKKGTDTIQKIIEKYAPKNENNTKAYIEAVSKSLKMSPTDIVDFERNPQLMKKLMEAVIKMEVGAKHAKDAKIDEGINQSNFGRNVMGANNTRLGTGQSAKIIHLNFNSNVNVTATDADSAGKSVASAQTRVYGDVIRNTRSVLT